MKTNRFNKKNKAILIVLAFALFGLGLVAFYNLTVKQGDVLNFMVYRFIRAIICFTYLGVIFLFKKKKTNPLFICFLVFYGLSSLFAVWYENNNLAILSMGLSVIAFLTLIRIILPKVELFKYSWFHFLSFIIMIVFNGFLSYQFIIMFKDFTLSNLHFTFIVFNVLGLVFISYLSVLFNHKHSSKSTLIFLGFILLLIFTEVFRGIAYYHIAYGDTSAHIARGLLIITLSLLTYYTFLEKKEEELLNNSFL